MKQPICTQCKKPFTRVYTTTQKTCSPTCAIEKVEQDKAKKAAREQKATDKIKRSDHRKAKESIKTRSQWLKDVQDNAFNPYIRKRDENLPCISCGKFVNNNDLLTGSRWDCGHYLTRGAFPELRFEELNAHKQCSSCNGGSGKFAKKNRAVKQEYTERLIDKIGIVQFEWLNSHHEPKKDTIEDLKELKKYFKDKLKHITC